MRTHYQRKRSGRGSRYAEGVGIGDTPTHKDLKEACDKRLKKTSDPELPDWVRELNERNK